MSEMPAQVQAANTRSDALLAQLMSPTPQPEAPTPPAPAAPAPAASPEVPREQTAEYWRQRFSVMQGKYDAEVPRLNQQLRERDARIAELEAKIAAPPATAAASTAVDLSSFDPELVDMTRTVARQVAQDAVRAFESRTPTAAPAAPAGPTPEQQEVQGRFLDQLSDLVEDWEAIDREQGWKAFLLQTEPDTGQPRQARLSAAARAFDVVTTASIFNAYKRARSARQTPSLEAQLDPGRASSGAAVAAETKRIIPRDEIRRFYADVNRGAIRDQAEITRRNKEIDDALREGRIQA